MGDGDKPAWQRLDELETSTSTLKSAVASLRSEETALALVNSAELKQHIRDVSDSQIKRRVSTARAFLLMVPPLLGIAFGWLIRWSQEVKAEENAAKALVQNTERKNALNDAIDSALEDFDERFKDARISANTAADLASEARGEAKAALAHSLDYLATAKSLLEESLDAQSLIKSLHDAQGEVVKAVTAEGSEFHKGVAKEMEHNLALSAPVGSILAWTNNTMPNDSWEICEGQRFEDDWDSTGLRKALPSGLGDELPDLRGYFLRGAGEADGLDADLESRSGAKGVGSSQPHGVADHAHDGVVSAPDEGDRFRMQSGGSQKNGVGVSWGLGNNKVTVTGEAIGASNETRPVNYAVHWIIRVK